MNELRAFFCYFLHNHCLILGSASSVIFVFLLGWNSPIKSKFIAIDCIDWSIRRGRGHKPGRNRADGIIDTLIHVFWQQLNVPFTKNLICFNWILSYIGDCCMTILSVLANHWTRPVRTGRDSSLEVRSQTCFICWAFKIPCLHSAVLHITNLLHLQGRTTFWWRRRRTRLRCTAISQIASSGSRSPLSLALLATAPHLVRSVHSSCTNDGATHRCARRSLSYCILSLFFWLSIPNSSNPK